jgi:hypothetical protein
MAEYGPTRLLGMPKYCSSAVAAEGAGCEDRSYLHGTFLLL